MAKIDLGNLTYDETKEVFTDAMALLTPLDVGEIILEKLSKDDRAELAALLTPAAETKAE